MSDEYVVACSGCGAEWRSRDPVPPLDHCPICPVSDRELDAMIAHLEAARAAKVKSLEAEIARLRLTDAEREALTVFAGLTWTVLRWSEVERHAATLRGLLERMEHRQT